MSLRTLPILFLNLGGEMLYILDQRLRAQSIPDEKARKGKIFSRADCQLLMASSSSFELFNFNKRIHAIISRSQWTLDCATWIKALQFHFSEQCGVAVVSKTSISDFICIGDNTFHLATRSKFWQVGSLPYLNIHLFVCFWSWLLVLNIPKYFMYLF